jgi:hypothetical protein
MLLAAARVVLGLGWCCLTIVVSRYMSVLLLVLCITCFRLLVVWLLERGRGGLS